MNGVERLGRYVLGDLLGEGATGRVYRATLLGPAGFRKPVAIKVLAPEVAHRDGLTREACLGGLIKHPHVVETWELGEWEGRPYVVMELVDGPSLAEVIGRGPLPPRAVVELGEHAAAGLAHIHRPASEGGPGLVHRDIKPANLLFDPVGLVKIADLGIALVLGDAARSLAGTPQWMAPEQARRQLEVTPAADVWALGMILVYAATGRRLPGSGALDVLRGAPVAWLEQQGTFDAVAAAVPGLAPVLRRVLVEAPAARPTAAEVLEQLRALHPTGPGLRAAIDLRPAASPHPTPERSPVASAAPTWDLVEGRTNVTPPADPFFGRDALLAQLLSGSDRIVTLTGPGGAGKTRLAREWALSALRTDPTWTGAWLVELEQAADAVGLARGVAAALGVPLIDARDPVSHVADAAAARGRTLVVLDNLEQVADAAGAVVARWAAAAPEVTWVITSRVPLRIAGERVVPVEALDPEAACALVRDRLVRAGVSPWPAPSVRALVDALDGVPLALVLAAARA
ncbi:MAG: protein kinase, partial [Myxococcota bacterium]